MKKISPEHISDLVNFQSNVLAHEWQFEPGKRDMRNLQVLGSAKIFNILQKHKVALLADEVGMGKTIQALSVCVAFWNQNPTARILVLAPRGEVALNWQREYKTFIHHHYRHKDNIVKTLSGEEPVKQMEFCDNLYDLVSKINEGWCRFFVGKISSFSSLLSKEDIKGRLQAIKIQTRKSFQGEKSQKNRDVAGIIKEHIDNTAESFSQPYFDLLIIDEAHYLRHKEGGSLRAESAKILFGDPDDAEKIPLARHVLLMTATPNHSSERDIYNVISYFTSKFQDNPQNYQKILQEICVRRLRRLSSKALNKYNYRHEQPVLADFRENPLGEIFFGIYQHELAKKLIQEDEKASGGGGISRMMKYLEGVEFISRARQEEQPEETGDGEDTNIQKNSNATDFSQGKDAEILYDLSDNFYRIFQKEPSHPKYERLIEVLSAGNQHQKAVVFVRRIPSVNEISARVKEWYDKEMWQYLQKAPWIALEFASLNRKSFQDAYLKYSSSTMVEMDDDTGEEEAEASPSSQDPKVSTSRVLDLFKIIKDKEPKSTTASNFRLRFNRSKPGPFTMFFSPGQDYFRQPFTFLKVFKYEDNSTEDENFFFSALEHRLKYAENAIDQNTRKDIANQLINKKRVTTVDINSESEPIETLMTVFWQVFETDKSIPEDDRDILLRTYQNFSPYEKEALSVFIEKGALLASVFIVNLFGLYIDLALGEDYRNQPLKIYRQMLDQLKDNLKDQRLYVQIQDSILQFRNIYNKQFNINHEIRLLKENWDTFDNAQPIYPYSAQAKNQKVLKCFNTPFFPDILVATSVLQEGVNLQFFCDTVHHYGMAWTPGDNEQRNGRIDRMFGKIERNLEKNEKSTLNIHYPFLKDTVDEEQLARFVRKKYHSELLIDQGRVFEDRDANDWEASDLQGWKKFLRSPDTATSTIADPYPALETDFLNIEPQSPVKSNLSFALNDFHDYISDAILSCKELNPEVFKIYHDDGDRLLADFTLKKARKQPTIVELIHDPVASGFDPDGEAVYCLTMKTPLTQARNIHQLKQFFELDEGELLQHYRMGVKICLDSQETKASIWEIYLCYQLPLFISDVQNHHLSQSEIQAGIRNLVLTADWIEENFLFGADITREELKYNLHKIDETNLQQVKKGRSRKFGDWGSVDGFYYKRIEIELKEKFNRRGTTSDNIKAILRDVLKINYQYPYVRVVPKNNKWYLEVSYLEEDAQQKELDLMAKHLEVANNSNKGQLY